jgi:branched-chain amino acid transport system ATP-binding protein
MILEICDITKKFGGITAINETSFNIKQNEIYGLIGPNGAGKTTMFNIITGNYEPTSGQVKFHGQRIDGLKPHKIVHRGIARTFQNIRLFNSMTVLENILIGFDYQAEYTYFEAILRLPRYFKEERRIKQRAFEIMTVLGLEDYADEMATSLSYGQQRKVEIARALAASPQLLLLDEPAAGMNPQETEELAQLFFKIRDDFDVTILLIEHDMKFVNKLCDRVMVLDYGKTIFEGHIKDAINDEEVIKAYLGDFKHA